MYTKKIDICIYIFIYTVYTWLSTTDTLKIQRLCYRVKPVFHRSLGAQNQRLWSAKKIWSGRVHVQRDSCSSTAPCVLKKGDRPRWPGRSCQWGCDLFKKSIVGKDGEHQIGCECLSLADQEHTACFFSNQTERENNVQYHSYNVQSNRTIRTEAMCRRHLRNLADETKRYFFFFFQ